MQCKACPQIENCRAGNTRCTTIDDAWCEKKGAQSRCNPGFEYNEVTKGRSTCPPKDCHRKELEQRWPNIDGNCTDGVHTVFRGPGCTVKCGPGYVAHAGVFGTRTATLLATCSEDGTWDDEDIRGQCQGKECPEDRVKLPNSTSTCADMSSANNPFIFGADHTCEYLCADGFERGGPRACLLADPTCAGGDCEVRMQGGECVPKPCTPSIIPHSASSEPCRGNYTDTCDFSCGDGYVKEGEHRCSATGTFVGGYCRHTGCISWLDASTECVPRPTNATVTETVLGQISCGESVSGNTIQARSMAGTNAAGEHVYTFAVTQGVTIVQFDSCASTFDTYLRVMTGQMSHEIAACNDCGSCGDVLAHTAVRELHSSRTAVLTAELVCHLPSCNHTLLIEGSGKAEGHYDVTMSCRAAGYHQSVAGVDERQVFTQIDPFLAAVAEGFARSYELQLLESSCILVVRCVLPNFVVSSGQDIVITTGELDTNMVLRLGHLRIDGALTIVGRRELQLYFDGGISFSAQTNLTIAGNVLLGDRRLLFDASAAPVLGLITLRGNVTWNARTHDVVLAGTLPGELVAAPAGGTAPASMPSPPTTTTLCRDQPICANLSHIFDMAEAAGRQTCSTWTPAETEGANCIANASAVTLPTGWELACPQSCHAPCTGSSAVGPQTMVSYKIGGNFTFEPVGWWCDPDGACSACIDCPQPCSAPLPAVDAGTLSLDDDDSFTAVLTCKQGVCASNPFMMGVTCTDGVWSQLQANCSVQQSPPKCTAKSLPRIEPSAGSWHMYPPIPYAALVCHSSRRDEYTFSSAFTSLRCQNGEWVVNNDAAPADSQPATCIPKPPNVPQSTTYLCSDAPLPNVRGGHFNVQDGGRSATLTCSSGYDLLNPHEDTIECVSWAWRSAAPAWAPIAARREARDAGVACVARGIQNAHSRLRCTHIQGADDEGQEARVCQQGRIEVYNGALGKWGTVCGHWLWNNDEAANIVCRAQGFAGGSMYTFGASHRLPAMDVVAGYRVCTGQEEHILQCPHPPKLMDSLPDPDCANGCDASCRDHALDQGAICYNTESISQLMPSIETCQDCHIGCSGSGEAARQSVIFGCIDYYTAPCNYRMLRDTDGFSNMVVAMYDTALAEFAACAENQLEPTDSTHGTGYCHGAISSAATLRNGDVCVDGSRANIGFHIRIPFRVNAEGLYTFRMHAKHGMGSFHLVDGAEHMWNNDDETQNAQLAVGDHEFELLSFENCCDEHAALEVHLPCDQPADPWRIVRAGVTPCMDCTSSPDAQADCVTRRSSLTAQQSPAPPAQLDCNRDDPCRTESVKTQCVACSSCRLGYRCECPENHDWGLRGC